MKKKLCCRDDRGRFINRKELVREMRKGYFFLGHVVRQEMILSYSWRITRCLELLSSIRDCRSLAKRIAREIREDRIRYRIYETF